MAAQVRLKGEITMDDNKFQSALRRAGTAAANFSKNFGSTMVTAGKIGFAGIVAGAGAAAAAMGVAVKRALDLGGRFSDINATTGESVSNLLVWTKVLEDAGVGGDALEGIIHKMQKAIENGSDAFGDLGINMRSLQAQSATQQLQTIGKALMNVANPATRAALSMEIFGKTGARMLTAFSDPAALENARGVLGSMPRILDKNAGLFDKISDSVASIGTKFDAWGVGIAAGVAPALEPLLDKLMKVDTAAFGEALGKDIGNAFTGQSTSKAIVDLAGRFVRIMVAATIALGDIMAASLTSAFKEPIAGLQASIESVIGKIQNWSSGKGLTADEESSLKFSKDRAKSLEENIRSNSEFVSKPRAGVSDELMQTMRNGITLDKESLRSAQSEILRLEEKRGVNADVGEIFAGIMASGGPKVGIGEGLTAEERMEKALARIAKSAEEEFPEVGKIAASAIEGEIAKSDFAARNGEINAGGDFSSIGGALKQISDFAGIAGANIKPIAEIKQQRDLGGMELKGPSRLTGKGYRQAGESAEEFRARRQKERDEKRGKAGKKDPAEQAVSLLDSILKVNQNAFGTA
jgi:hypothetical protein